MIIGITGKSGSGKSTIADMIGNLDKSIKIVHIDQIGHEVMTYPTVKEQLIIAFGKDIVDDAGIIDRKRVGDLVFNNRDKMAKLTDITWSYMEKELDEIVIHNDIVVLDWILLPLAKYFNKCDIKILVDVPYKVRKEKAIERDNISPEKFDEREKASIKYNKKDFDYIIKNDYKSENNQKKVRDIYDKSIISGKF